jgi:hypothetical protein
MNAELIVSVGLAYKRVNPSTYSARGLSARRGEQLEIRSCFNLGKT